MAPYGRILSECRATYPRKVFRWFLDVPGAILNLKNATGNLEMLHLPHASMWSLPIHRSGSCYVITAITIIVTNMLSKH